MLIIPPPFFLFLFPCFLFLWVLSLLIRFPSPLYPSIVLIWRIFISSLSTGSPWLYLLTTRAFASLYIFFRSHNEIDSVTRTRPHFSQNCLSPHLIIVASPNIRDTTPQSFLATVPFMLFSLELFHLQITYPYSFSTPLLAGFHVTDVHRSPPPALLPRVYLNCAPPTKIGHSNYFQPALFPLFPPPVFTPNVFLVLISSIVPLFPRLSFPLC